MKSLILNISSKNFVIILFFATIFFSFGFLKAGAAIITVNDPTGVDIDNVLCSIVEASINSKNGNTSGSVDCVAGSGAENDIISIQTDITLTTPSGNEGVGPFGVYGPRGVTINGNDHTIKRDLNSTQFGIFFFAGPSDIVINNLTIEDGSIVDDSGQGLGAGIYASTIKSLTLNNVNFNNNNAINGGAVYLSTDSSPNTTLTINNSSFTNNSAKQSGGALYIKNTSNTLNTIIYNSVFDTNSSDGNGGAVFADNLNSLDISRSYFTSNTANESKGGVVYLSGTTSASVDNSYFYFNRPTTLQGGIFYLTSQSELVVNGSTFENNIAVFGGIFYLLNGAGVTVVNSTFEGSTGITSGGVIYSYQGLESEPNRINFYHNTTSRSFSGSDSGATIFNCIISEGSCLGSTEESPFTGDSYFFENNIFTNCGGNLKNASFLNNLGGNATCVESGSNNNPTDLSYDMSLDGGLWKTLPLLSLSSNAIDAGVAGTLGCPPKDGRGVSRPQGSKCDIGAYEYTQVSQTTSEGDSNSSQKTGDSSTSNVVYGCLDQEASNYNIEATESDNSCGYAIGFVAGDEESSINVENKKIPAIESVIQNEIEKNKIAMADRDEKISSTNGSNKYVVKYNLKSLIKSPASWIVLGPLLILLLWLIFKKENEEDEEDENPINKDM